MAEMDEQVKEKLNLIETLTQQIEELIKKKGEIVKDINEPIYKAKREAEAITKAVQEKVDLIVAEVEKKKVAFVEYARKKDQEIEVNLNAARKGYEAFRTAQAEFDKSVEDFNASKYAFETNLQQQKREAESTLAKGIELQNAANARKVNLDSQESTVNQKAIAMQDLEKKIEQIRAKTEQYLQEIKDTEAAIAAGKEEVAKIKVQNDELLIQVKTQQEKSKSDVETNEKLSAEIKAMQLDIKNTEHEIDEKLNRAARRDDELDEREKTLAEEKRLVQLLQRQVDEKIRTLNKLRAEEEERKAKENKPE